MPVVKSGYTTGREQSCKVQECLESRREELSDGGRVTHLAQRGRSSAHDWQRTRARWWCMGQFGLDTALIAPAQGDDWGHRWDLNNHKLRPYRTYWSYQPPPRILHNIYTQAPTSVHTCKLYHFTSTLYNIDYTSQINLVTV